MAAKKYKPALFELVNKGPLKPSDKGSLGTPRWFYKKKATVAGKPDGGTGNGVGSGGSTGGKAFVPFDVAHRVKQQDEAVVAEASKVNAGVERQAPAEGQAEDVRAEDVTAVEEAGGGEDDEPRMILGFPVSVWATAVGVFIIAAVLLFSLFGPDDSETGGDQGVNTGAVSTGSGGTSGSTGTTGNASQPRVITNSPGATGSARSTGSTSTGVRYTTTLPGTTPGRTAPITDPTAPTRPTVTATPAATAGASRPTVTPAERHGQCWIICSHNDLATLKPVQMYFNSKGIMTDIGKFGGYYVLYTTATFESRHDSKAAALKERVGTLGSNYNQEKPDGAPPFNPSTFQQAYAINVERIEAAQ